MTNFPEISLAHLERLTDHFSIWQHTHGTEIFREEGYALDDAVRALIVACQYQRQDLAEIYLGFISHACLPDKVINFFDEYQQPRDLPWSPDALGETYWALTRCSKDFPELTSKADSLIRERIIPHIGETHRHLRATAYIVLGGVIHGNTDQVLKGARILYDAYQENSLPNWPWLEQGLFYGNSILPQALIEAGEFVHNPTFTEAGVTMLHFLNDTCQEHGVPSLIGSNGWWLYGKERAHFAQQPIDACYQVQANISAYTITQNTSWLLEAERFYSWFWGNNIVGAKMIRDDGSCSDGLEEDGPSLNRGSESTICFLMAQAALKPYLNTLAQVRAQ
jgi:hypothetical protein